MAALNPEKSPETENLPEPETPRYGPVDVVYVLVRSHFVGDKENEYYERDTYVRIYSACEEPESDGYFICAVKLVWHGFRINLTCLYDPLEDVFSEFQRTDRTMDRGPISEIGTLRIDCSRVLSDKHGAFSEHAVKDDYGNMFLFVNVEMGYLEGKPVVGQIIGKKATPEVWMKDVKLSMGEEKRLDLEDPDDEWAWWRQRQRKFLSESDFNEYCRRLRL